MINKETPVSFDKICRSCMGEEKQLRSVYDTNSTVQLAEMIMACASVQVVSGDGLPSSICLKCEENLNIAYEFKQQCERIDTALREIAPLHDSTRPDLIKDESESLDIVVKPDIEIYDDHEDQDDDDNDNDDNEPYNSESEASNYSTTVRRKKKPPKNRQCRYCSKMLSTKEGLKLHERRHTGEKLKSCPVCPSKFAKSNHLIRHMSSHNKPTDEYKHTCLECGMGFMKASHLLKHHREHKNRPEGESGEANAAEVPVGLEMMEDNVEDDDDDTGADNTLDDEAIDPVVKKEVDSDDGMETKPVLGKMRTRTKKESVDIHRLYPCKVCLKSFTKSNHLTRHMATHSAAKSPKEKSNEPKEKKYMACEFCDRKFVYKKSFLHHIQMEHQISEDDDTPLSEYATIITKPKVAETKLEPGTSVTAENGGGEDDFDEFMRQEEAKKIHACHVCNHKFTRANHLTRHMTLHRAVLTHKCERCEKAFMTAEHLATHVQEYHVDRPYVCSLCQKPFSRGEHLIRHLKVHDKEACPEMPPVDPSNPSAPGVAPEAPQAHKCSICDKEFSRTDHLARHTKLHLAQDKRHVCGECGKAFNRLDNLRTHSRIHTGQRDPQRLHLCIYCGKEFNNSSNMIVHMRRHTGERPYKCAQCGKGFPRSHDLKCHERTHSGEKPYLCTLCGKSFNKSNKLLRHTRVHTGERPYVCSLCGRAFTQSNDLALHMRRHTGSRPYACGMCPARFIQSGQLKAHRRSQGHWLETPPDLKGAHRVAPVTPLVNPPPIKFKTRVQRIKEEPSILGHTIGVSSLAGVVAAAAAAAAASAAHTAKDLSPEAPSPFYITQPPSAPPQPKDLKLEDSFAASVTNLSRDTVSAGSSVGAPTFQQQQQPGPDPATSYANSLTMSTPSFAVSEGYNTYQSYG